MRGTRARLVAVALGLMAVAVLAAPDGLPFGESSASPQRLVLPDPPDLLGYLFLLLMLTMFAFYLFIRISGFADNPRRQSRSYRMNIGLLFLLLALWAALPPVQRVVTRSLNALGIGEADERPGSPNKDNGGGPEHDSSSTFGYVVTAIVLVVVGGSVTLAVVALRRQIIDPPSETPEAELLDSVDASIEDLETIEDPREAVLACYARMQVALSHAGIKRRVSDTPLELLARLLDSHSVPEVSARTLTDLFQAARFGKQRVDEAMRRRALAAFNEIRSEMGALQ